jgi:hypothetical protein
MYRFSSRQSPLEERISISELTEKFCGKFQLLLMISKYFSLAGVWGSRTVSLMCAPFFAGVFEPQNARVGSSYF